MRKIELRRMRNEDEDYALLAEWLSCPEVEEFYTTHPSGIDAVREKYQSRVLNQKDFFCVIIEVNDHPAGYIQYYKLDYEEYELDKLEETIRKYNNVYAADMFLGRTEFIGQGIGSEALKTLVDYIFYSTGSELIIVDPLIINKRAIRCYEKAGFEPIGVLRDRDWYRGVNTDSLIMGRFRAKMF